MPTSGNKIQTAGFQWAEVSDPLRSVSLSLDEEVCSSYYTECLDVKSRLYMWPWLWLGLALALALD